MWQLQGAGTVGADEERGRGGNVVLPLHGVQKELETLIYKRSA